MIHVHFISSQDTTIKAFEDQFLGLKTIYDEAKFPYSILVEDQEVKGLIVVAREPRELIQPAGTAFTQIHIFVHDDAAVKQLVEEAKALNVKHQGAFIGCVIDAEHSSAAEQLEEATLELFDESYKMVCMLEAPTYPESLLTFQRAQPREADTVLRHLIPIMQGSPDHLMNASVQNLSKLSSEMLSPILTQMEVIFVRKQTNIIGLLSFTGPTISLIGVLPNERGQGFGRLMTQWAKAYLAENGHIRAMLRVSVENKPAIHIYEAEGFRITNHMKYFLKKNPSQWL